ncbi:MAG: hypothetical protein LUD17_16535 [Bacteroidales bacterium]|nr:hypothetical protein [Bacteroidales bacterium]
MECTWIDIVGVVGSLLSLGGVILTLIQVIKTKKASQAVLEATNEIILRFNREISISNISKHMEIIEAIKTYLIEEKYELALFKMYFIKDWLIELKAIPVLLEFIEEEKTSQLVKELSSDIYNLENKLVNDTVKIKPLPIFSHLDTIKENFIVTRN